MAKKKEIGTNMFKRYCDIHELPEISELKSGMDFRNPMYRREVFLRFYEFHLKYRAHPGAVYYVIPYLSKKYNWTKEQQYWFCFINGATQNPCTSLVIFQAFPNFEDITEEKFEKWHQKYWKKLQYDIDRRYQKGHMVEMFLDYKKNLKGRTQVEFFERDLANTDDPNQNFWNVWNAVFNGFKMYGRLSTFSYSEYLKIIGLNIDCPSLFMDDLKGSQSHRNGVAKVIGRDDLDWHKSNPILDYKLTKIEEFYKNKNLPIELKKEISKLRYHDKDTVKFLEKEAKLILNDAQERFKNRDFFHDVCYYTLESTLCCYKSWYRPNRRYPNVYNDMFYDRIKHAEKQWKEEINNGEISFDIFWEARKESLPEYLRCESSDKYEKGITSHKQNWYRTKGEVIFMDFEDNTFKNNFIQDPDNVKKGR